MAKCKSKFLPAAFAWCLLLSLTTLFFYYPCLHWYLWVKKLWVIPLYQGILTVFVVMNFSLATFMDPGVIPRASADEDRDDDFRAPLYRNVEINGITVRMKWCVTCQFYRPPRCSHCSVCNNCIEIFDHHCPWVNNCIGRRNYRYFFMFLISLSIHMTSIFILCLIHVIHNKDNLTAAPVLVSLIIMAIISLLFIPIFGLTGFHMVLVSRGRTTNEQVTGKFRGGYNPFSKNCCFNCCYTLCGPQYPSLKHPAKYIGKKPRKYTIPAKPLGPQQASMSAVPSTGDQMNMVDRNEMDDELDEPMASQSVDSEAPLTRNSSKNNFFASPDEQPPSTQSMGAPRGSFKNTQGKFNPQYMKGSPHSSQRGKRSQTPDHMLASSEMQQGGGGVEMKPLHQVQTSMASNIHSPSVAQKVSRMGVPTPFAGVTSVPSPIRYSHPTVTSGARPEYISLAQQQTIMSRPYDHDMSKSYSPGTLYGQATSPGRRYMSDGELLDSSIGIPTSSAAVVTSVGAGVDLSGSSTSPQRTYYVWKDPPQTHLSGYNHPVPGGPGSQYPVPDTTNSPVRHASYASQVGYYLQQQQNQQQVQQPPQQPTPQPPIQLQSGGPRTTPSGYPGGPVVPSGNMSSPTATASVSMASSHHMVPAVGYTTTGRPSTHQQQPMSFTRALEISENLDQQQQSQQVQTRYLRTSNQTQQPQGQPQQPSSLQPPSSLSSNEAKQSQNSQNNEDPRRDSVYDMNSYEISV